MRRNRRIRADNGDEYPNPSVPRAVATRHIPRRLALNVSLTKSLGYINSTLIQRAGVGGNDSNNGHVRCWNH